MGTKWQKHTKSKPKSQENQNLNQHSTLKTVHTYHCTKLYYAIPHRTVMTVFFVTVRTITAAQMLFTKGEGEQNGERNHNICDTKK